jgi:hypothetical protein
MENACVVTVYDFVHKNHISHSLNTSITCTHPRGVCTLLVNHRSTRSKTPRTLTWNARPWRWRHYSPSELWIYSPSPNDTISSPRWWASHCIGYQVYRSPDIPYPSQTMEVTFLKAPTVGQTMVDVQWSTKGLHNCVHTHQSLCCMFIY